MPNGQAELLRVPFGNTLPVKVPQGPPDQRYVSLSDGLPTAWQAVAYAAIPPGGSVTVLGLGPLGDMAARIALHQGASKLIGADLVSERLARARSRGVHALDLNEFGNEVGEEIRRLTAGRGTDAVIEAVGMEAHSAPPARTAQRFAGLLPNILPLLNDEDVPGRLACPICLRDWAWQPHVWIGSGDDHWRVRCVLRPSSRPPSPAGGLVTRRPFQGVRRAQGRRRHLLSLLQAQRDRRAWHGLPPPCPSAVAG